MTSKIEIVIIFLMLLFVYCSQPKKNIFLIGDSTMAEYDSTAYPLTGWGEKLYLFFNNNVIVHNFAVSGYSSKMFRDKLAWRKVNRCLNEGDYLIIQFGHNDAREDSPSHYAAAGAEYNDNLKRFIKEAREKGAIPIFATPIERRKFDEEGSQLNTHGAYPDEMRKVAKEMNVPLIDLNKKTKLLIEKYGIKSSKELFLYFEAGQYSNYPNGKEDNQHLSPLGAFEVCRLAVDEIKRLNLGLNDYIVEPKEGMKQIK